jgi:hypothetical protein
VRRPCPRGICNARLEISGDHSTAQELGCDGAGESAPAEEGFVVAEANAIDDAGAEARSLEFPGLDPAANGLLLGADGPGDSGSTRSTGGIGPRGAR